MIKRARRRDITRLMCYCAVNVFPTSRFFTLSFLAFRNSCLSFAKANSPRRLSCCVINRNSLLNS